MAKTKFVEIISELLSRNDEMALTQLEADEIIPYTDDEALALIEDLKLTGNQYETILIQAQVKNANIYFLYNRLADVKRRYYPPDCAFKLTEDNFSIST